MQVYKFYHLLFKKQSKAEVMAFLEAKMKKKEGVRLYTPNPEILLLSRENPVFLKTLQQAELLLCDGHGIPMMIYFHEHFGKLSLWQKYSLLPFYYFYFLFFSRKIIQKTLPILTGSDFMDTLVQWANQEKKSIFFLGGAEDVAKACQAIYQNEYPELKIMGASSADPSPETLQNILEIAPDVLLLAYGAPKQELFIQNLYEAGLTQSIMMGLGGSFDFKTKRIRRAPFLLRKLGLEWLWRLFLHPKQRARRIFRAFIQFPLDSISYDEKVSPLPPE